MIYLPEHIGMNNHPHQNKPAIQWYQKQTEPKMKL